MGLILFIFVSLLVCQLSEVDAAATYANGGCGGGYDTGDYVYSEYGNYTEGSAYQQNLENLFSNLSSQASIVKFYNSTAGDVPHIVYGLFQCREDVSLEVCSGCVEDATKKIVQVCPLYGEAVVWYYECTLRYANRSIFSLSETVPIAEECGPSRDSNYDQFARVLANTMNSLISQAANVRSSGHFATSGTNLTLFDNLYSLAQCTPDIDGFGCNYCLRSALSQMSSYCNATSSAMFFMPSCQLRYDTSPFFNSTDRAPHAPPPSKASKRRENQKNSSHIAMAVSIPIVLAVLLLSGVSFCIYNHKKSTTSSSPELDEIITAESLQFDFKTIRVATDNFSLDNKLGEGGFGVVFKGRLQNGQEIAVKRLSTNSGQGIKEFKTEVLLVAKLQHKNLARLLGFCLRAKEKLLVYEFLPNSSLDKVLLVADPKQQQGLDWETRYKIIAGIARGLLYLHQDSRLTIIHRDLKSSNILLDENMDPKISDFGLARLVGADQIQADTKRIVGTYGYMAPEYAMTGRFSVKSDVYSFGVIVLEIVSGHKCSSTAFPFHKEALAQRAWRLWNEGAALELVDLRLGDDFKRDEVVRCIHIGLLCIQGDANKRPTMTPIVSALNGHPVVLPDPTPPQLITTTTSESSGQSSATFSGTKDTTEVYPR